MITASAIPEYLIGTKEFVKAQVTNSVDLDAQPVTLLLDGTEYPAQWVGDVGTTRICRTTSIINFTTWTPGLYSLAVNFTDSPEEPLIPAGYISVRNP